MRKQKRALVLSGGGATAAFHLGVIEQLYRQGHRWDVFCGTSAGAIQAAYLAQFKDLQLDHILRLQDIWASLTKWDIINFRFPWLLAALWKPSVLKDGETCKLIHKHLNPELLRNSGNKLFINTIDLMTGKEQVFREFSPDVRSCVQASAAIPGIFPPVFRDGMLLVDGGVRSNTLGKMGLMMRDEVDVSICNNGLEDWDYGKRPSTPEIIGRTLNIVMDEAFSNDYAFYEGVTGYRPTIKLPGTMSFSWKNYKLCVLEGYKVARR